MPVLSRSGTQIPETRQSAKVRPALNFPAYGTILTQYRHVRVHHPEKDKDDILLREVLSQRSDGPSRGRRRRGAS